MSVSFVSVVLSILGVPSKTVLVALLVAGATASTAQYSATLLHPEGYIVSGASTGFGVNLQVGYAYSATVNESHAMHWRGSAASAVDLHPDGFDWSTASDAFGNRQIGAAKVIGGDLRALLWNGSANDYIDLTPEGFSAVGMGMTQDSQVGYINTGNHTRASMWNGSAVSVVDLHPDGYNISFGMAIAGSQQVGYARPNGNDNLHAMLWSGSSASALDLNPAGFTRSQSLATDGVEQVGYAATTPQEFDRRAMLWRGSAGSAVNLNPSGSVFSQATDVLNGVQVGFARSTFGGSSNVDHAFLWHGTAASAFDLHPFATGLWMNGAPLEVFESDAYGIDAAGNIVGSVFTVTGQRYAVMWRPVPEPVTMTTLLLACIGFVVRTARPKHT